MCERCVKKKTRMVVDSTKGSRTANGEGRKRNTAGRSGMRYRNVGVEEHRLELLPRHKRGVWTALSSYRSSHNLGLVETTSLQRERE